MFKNSLFSFSSCRLSHLILTTWLYSCCLFSPFVSCKCLDNQKSLLLEFKNNLTFDEHVATDKLVGWNQSTDCCQWNGVECDRSNGRVIGLDLSEKDITGGINNSSSLFRMQYLQKLNLAYNYLPGEMPSAFGKLTSLTHLELGDVGFRGQVPIEISQLVNLVVLDISDNVRLHMKRPNLATIIQNMTNLKELYLDRVSNSAMGNRWCHALSSSLPHLQVLSMAYCDLRGEIHKSLSNLKHLSDITLDHNDNLTGPIPESFGDFTNLTSLSIRSTNLTGTIPVKLFQIPTLRSLDLALNSNLQGTFPEYPKSGSLEELSLSAINFSSPLASSITYLKRLRRIYLDSCHFYGSMPSSIGNLNRLVWLDLSDNQFEGPIPKSLFQLKELDSLYLSSNRLNGTLQLAEFLHSFKKLMTLDLSNNALSIITDDCGVNSSFPQLGSLDLASCNLHSIPEFLKNQTRLTDLDLAMNRLTGPIPGWIWRTVGRLNLSSNHFVELEPPLTHSFPEFAIDLHSNNLQGEFPFFLSSPNYLDCSKNNFTSIHPNFGNFSSASFISFSRNSLYGNIPTSLCNATELGVLNLEYNHLGGTIPDCLLAMPQLYVLNLRRNNLSGDIPDNFRKGCSLQTLQVNENLLQGKIPPSLARCKPLKVLDLGYNQLKDTFPCHLKSLSNLQVLILRSNNLHGTMVCLQGHSIWPLLQIVDLASNHFSGNLCTLFLLKWKSMMLGKRVVQSKPEHLESYVQGNGIFEYYQNSVAVTLKGLEYDLQYILTIFNSIDVSNNAFHGELPTELGNLNALKVLNLSHNFLSGHIPPSLGSLSQIESLDLSCNTFSGRIPPQLASLNFLEYLNLSYNKLSGKIPTGTQLQTFGVSSYEGNQGLYGPPLPNPVTTPSISSKGSSWSSKDQIEWMLMGAEVGIPVGITIFLAPLLYITRYREWYCKHLHNLVMKIMCKEDGPKGRGRSRQQRQRR